LSTWRAFPPPAQAEADRPTAIKSAAGRRHLCASIRRSFESGSAAAYARRSPRPVTLRAIKVDLFAFLLLGLGGGAIYGALGLGLVLTHRASGVVNFAHGAMAMYAAYVFEELRTRGDLVLPVVGPLGRIHVAHRAPFPVALVVALAAAALLGLAAHRLLFHPLRDAPALARVVASVGLMVTLQALVALQFGPANRPVAPILPAHPVRFMGTSIPADRLYLALLVVVAAAALWSIYRFTRFGLASRAAAEDHVAVALLGWSPAALGDANWVMASVLAGLAGILVSPITQLNPVTYTLFVVPALAAALVGRLSSFGLTVGAALVLGMARSEVVGLQARFPSLPRMGLAEGLPLLMILVAMALSGAVNSRRGTGTAGPGTAERMPSGRYRAGLPPSGRPRRPVLATLGVGGVAALIIMVVHGQARLALVNSTVGAMVCLSLVVIVGYAGQISLSQMAFAGTAGFVLSRLGHNLGVPFPVAPFLAAAAACLIGVAVGLPALRTRGSNLAVLTLAAAVAAEELVFKAPLVSGGLRGSPIPRPSLAGVDLAITGRRPGQFPTVSFGLFALTVLAALALGVAALRRRPLGRRMLAVRANERAASAAGIDPVATKLLAFGLSAFCAGVAGALIAYQQGTVSFESFGVFVSLSYLAVAYVGGVASIAGALVGGSLVAGGILFTAVEDVAGLGRYQLLTSGIALMVMAVMRPDGLAGAAQRILLRHRESTTRRLRTGDA